MGGRGGGVPTAGRHNRTGFVTVCCVRWVETVVRYAHDKEVGGERAMAACRAEFHIFAQCKVKDAVLGIFRSKARSNRCCGSHMSH